MSDKELAEIVYYQSLEKDAVTPEELEKFMINDRKNIENRSKSLPPGMDNYYLSDTEPIQEYGGYGEKDIPARYRYFISRVGEEIKKVADSSQGFESMIYPMFGTDISIALELIKDGGELITIDSDDIFHTGTRIKQQDRETLDTYEMQKATYQKATQGMNSVEVKRNAWALSGEFALMGANPETGDGYKILHQETESIEPDIIPEHRGIVQAEIIYKGKKIKWTHYKVTLSTESLIEGNKYYSNTTVKLRDHVKRLQSAGNSLLLSKADINGNSVRPFTRSDCLISNPNNPNFICIDKPSEVDISKLGIKTKVRSLEGLRDINPTMSQEEVEKHHLLHRNINFGYQSYPSQIFLGEIIDKEDNN